MQLLGTQHHPEASSSSPSIYLNTSPYSHSSPQKDGDLTTYDPGSNDSQNTLFASGGEDDISGYGATISSPSDLTQRSNYHPETTQTTMAVVSQTTLPANQPMSVVPNDPSILYNLFTNLMEGQKQSKEESRALINIIRTETQANREDTKQFMINMNQKSELQKNIGNHRKQIHRRYHEVRR
jgi:hypothetical protein